MPAKGNYWDFETAKKYVKNLQLKSSTEWKKFCDGGSLPVTIPKAPHMLYNEWTNWGDWLGTGAIATHLKQYSSFEEARAFARSLGLKSRSEWNEYAKQGGNKPDNIPFKPERTYKDCGWIGVGDWLGTGTIAPFLREYKSFNEARSFVQKLELKSGEDWKVYCRSGSKPADIPNAPQTVYEEWNGIGDWLGTGTIAPALREYLPFNEARLLARSLGLSSGDKWTVWHRENKPKNIPAAPDQVYTEWVSWFDWLGTKEPIRSKEQFIEKAKEVHSDKYNYDLVVYKDSKTPVQIVCPVHGVFLQMPNTHIYGNKKGSGCTRCAGRVVNGQRLERVPVNYWGDIENQREFLAKLKSEYNICSMDDWYSVPSGAFPQQFLKIYGQYHCNILAFHFPEFHWQEWRFNRTPNKFWQNKLNHSRYMDWLGKKLGCETYEDWYKVKGEDFFNNCGEGLLVGYYNGSYQKAIMSVYDNFPWQEWRFASTPDGLFDHEANRVRYLDWLGEKLGFTKEEDWLRLSSKMLMDNSGYPIYQYYGSLFEIVSKRYPDHTWYEWMFQHCPPNFWSNKENRKRYLKWLGEQLKFSSIEDWYIISKEILDDNCGGGFIGYYNGSPIAAVKDVFDEHEWIEWKFKNGVPQGFWQKHENCVAYMNWLGKQLGYSSMEDWYQIRAEDFKQYHGSGMIVQYGSSPSLVLKAIYPDQKWDVHKFNIVPNGYWPDSINKRAFLDNLFIKLGYKEKEDWYKCSQKDVADNGGCGLIRHTGGSHIQAIMEAYPEIDWKEWMFHPAPQGFWQNTANSHRYMEWLGGRLGYHSVEDWYNISTEDFTNNYGGGMLAVCYESSCVKAVKSYLPNYDWLEWKFKNGTPQGFWQDRINRVRYMNWLGDLFGFKEPKDWYDITQKRFEQNYGYGILDYGKGIINMMIDYMPDYKWNPSAFVKNRRNQRRIYNLVKTVWSDAEWEHGHELLRYDHSGRKMKVDVWIPSINLVIEYHGEQHFILIEKWGGAAALLRTQQRDKEKRDKCKQNGVELLEIDYDKWDGKRRSLFAMIKSKIGVHC